LQSIIEANDISEDLFTCQVIKEGIEPLKESKILDGFAWPECPQVSRSTKYLCLHYLKIILPWSVLETGVAIPDESMEIPDVTQITQNLTFPKND
jgi:hypothetical protein